MELKPLSPEMDELRRVIISSNLTSCYLILEEITSGKSERLFYDQFRSHWIDVFKNVYGHVAKMKARSHDR